MAQIYHPKKTSTKLLEGAVAGLLGGLAVAVLMLLWDGLVHGQWLATPTAIGRLFTGEQANATGDATTPFLLGLIIHFLLFALIGLGFVQYMPLVRRFKFNPMLAGAIYGAALGLLLFYVFFNSIRPDIVRAIDNKALIVASAVGGAVMGWWLSRPDSAAAVPQS